MEGIVLIVSGSDYYCKYPFLWCESKKGAVFGIIIKERTSKGLSLLSVAGRRESR